MKRKRDLIDRLEFTGSHEEQMKTAKERLERLKNKDFSFLGYGIKRTLKTKISKWIKTKIKKVLNKVQTFLK